LQHKLADGEPAQHNLVDLDIGDRAGNNIGLRDVDGLRQVRALPFDVQGPDPSGTGEMWRQNPDRSCRQDPVVVAAASAEENEKKLPVTGL
jgi:hypothetical protein